MKRKILLVDDEKDVLSVIGKRISDWGYETIKVASGREAIDAVKRESPDIIILDYMMPDMDGIATLKEIRTFNKNIPVIMFTAYPDERSIKGSEKLGVAAYIPKFNLHADVEDVLRTAVRLAESRLEDSSNA